MPLNDNEYYWGGNEEFSYGSPDRTLNAKVERPLATGYSQSSNVATRAIANVFGLCGKRTMLEIRPAPNRVEYTIIASGDGKCSSKNSFFVFTTYTDGTLKQRAFPKNADGTCNTVRTTTLSSDNKLAIQQQAWGGYGAYGPIKALTPTRTQHITARMALIARDMAFDLLTPYLK